MVYKQVERVIIRGAVESCHKGERNNCSDGAVYIFQNQVEATFAQSSLLGDQGNNHALSLYVYAWVSSVGLYRFNVRGGNQVSRFVFSRKSLPKSATITKSTPLSYCAIMILFALQIIKSHNYPRVAWSGLAEI